MKKLLAIFLMSGFLVSANATAELGEKDSKCLYTKCEMERSDAASVNKSETTKEEVKKGSNLNI